MKKKSKLTEEEIIALYETKCVREIANLNGTSNVIVLRVLHKHKVKMRKRGFNELRKDHPWKKHGYASDAKKVGMVPHTYIRLLVLAKLGGKCCKCGEDDIRVLEINHINGEDSIKYSDNTSRNYSQFLEILDGKELAVEVCCANCNVIHEYERGNRKIHLDVWNSLMKKRKG